LLLRTKHGHIYVIASVAILAILLVSSYFTFYPEASSSTSTIKVTKFSLPTGDQAIGLEYYQGWVYYASETYGYVLKVNATSGAVVNITQATGTFNRLYQGIAIDNNGNIWLTRSYEGNDGTLAGISFVNATTAYFC
jgi:streptogramin lyase